MIFKDQFEIYLSNESQSFHQQMTSPTITSPSN
jgi:hypothetical protein